MEQASLHFFGRIKESKINKYTAIETGFYSLFTLILQNNEQPLPEGMTINTFSGEYRYLRF